MKRKIKVTHTIVMRGGSQFSQIFFLSALSKNSGISTSSYKIDGFRLVRRS